MIVLTAAGLLLSLATWLLLGGRRKDRPRP